MGTPEELAFLLQESGTALVDAGDVLQAVDTALANKSRFLPKGMTEADAWMARNGNPLASTEAAMQVAYLAGKILFIKMKVDAEKGRSIVIVGYAVEDGLIHGDGDAETLPIAICAAVLDALDKKGKMDV